MAAKQVGTSKPDVRFDGDRQWMVPEPSVARYHGYLADMYHQVDEMRMWKRKWYDGRAAYVSRNPDNLQGDEGDRKKSWAKTTAAQDAAGMEQWAQRQVLAYAAAADAELDRLKSAGIEVPS